MAAENSNKNISIVIKIKYFIYIGIRVGIFLCHRTIIYLTNLYIAIEQDYSESSFASIHLVSCSEFEKIFYYCNIRLYGLQWARKFKKVPKKKLVNQINLFFSYLADLNLSPFQKLVFGHF